MEDFKEKFVQFEQNSIQIIHKSELFSDSEIAQEPNSDPLAKPFHCDYCDKWFVNRGHLTQHLGAKHKFQMCFTCESCQERFSMHKELKEHYKIHHQELGKRRQHSIKLDHSYCMKALDNIVLDHPYYKSAPRGPPKLPNLSRAKKTIDGNVISYFP